MAYDDLDRWDGGVCGREVQEGGDVFIHKADSLHCTEDTHNTVKQIYSNKKKDKIVLEFLTTAIREKKK